MRSDLLRESLVLAAVLSLALAGPAMAYKESGVKGGGAISGVIKFEGDAPKPKQLSVNKDKNVCGKKPIFDESLLVKDGGVQWAVISVKGVKAGKKWGDLKKASVDQNGCVYHPRVAVMKPGSRLTVLNSDKILHNVHTHPGDSSNPVANVAQPKFKKKLRLSSRYFKKTGIVKLSCDVHDWMTGYVVAAESPYVAVSAEGGKFEIKDVPAGSYTVEIWHETLGKKTVKVDVKAGATTTLDVTLKK